MSCSHCHIPKRGRPHRTGLCRACREALAAVGRLSPDPAPAATAEPAIRPCRVESWPRPAPAPADTEVGGA